MKARSAKHLIAYWANKRRGPQCRGLDYSRVRVQSSRIDDGTDIVVGSLIRGVLEIGPDEVDSAVRWATESDDAGNSAPPWLGKFAELAREAGILECKVRPVAVSRFADGERIKARETNMWDDKDPDKVLTEGEVAAMLGVSTQTVARMRKAGSGPPTVRIGARWMYSVSGLRKWWQERESGLAGGG
jgi:predicted DNA-binding transcriptional regulator AlpA